MTDRKQLVLEIKSWLDDMENKIDLPISEQLARKLLEDCYEVLKGTDK